MQLPSRCWQIDDCIDAYVFIQDDRRSLEPAVVVSQPKHHACAVAPLYNRVRLPPARLAAPSMGSLGSSGASLLMLLAAAAVLAACPASASLGSWRRALLRAPGAGTARGLLDSSFSEATPCMGFPSATTAQPDRAGRLWGWENGRSCVFRWGDKPAFYMGYQPGSWVLAPACLSPPFAPNAVTVRARSCQALRHTVCSCC